MSLENKVKLQFNRESQAWISWVASSVDHLRSIYEPLKQFKKKFFFFCLTCWHVWSSFPSQGSNRQLRHWNGSLNPWTAREAPMTLLPGIDINQNLFKIFSELNRSRGLRQPLTRFKDGGQNSNCLAFPQANSLSWRPVCNGQRLSFLSAELWEFAWKQKFLGLPWGAWHPLKSSYERGLLPEALTIS